MTHKEKRTALELVGWKFERYSRSRKRWVREIGGDGRRIITAVAYHWQEHEALRELNG